MCAGAAPQTELLLWIQLTVAGTQLPSQSLRHTLPINLPSPSNAEAQARHLKQLAAAIRSQFELNEAHQLTVTVRNPTTGHYAPLVRYGALSRQCFALAALCAVRALVVWLTRALNGVVACAVCSSSTTLRTSRLWYDMHCWQRCAEPVSRMTSYAPQLACAHKHSLSFASP